MINWDKYKERLEKSKLPLIGIFFIIVLYIGSIFAFSGLIAEIVVKNIVVQLFVFIFIITMTLIYAVGLFYLLRKFFNQLSIQYSKSSIKFSEANNYLLFALTLSVVLLSYGLNLYNNIYKPDLPIITYSLENPHNLSINLVCNGINWMDYPVYDDKFSCISYVKNPTKLSFELTTIRTYDYFFSSDNLSHKTPMDINQEILPNSVNEQKFSFPIGEYGIHYIDMFFNFRNDSVWNSVKMKRFSYIPLTQKEYNQRKDERITLLFLLISIGLFSVFSITNNIKNIIEK